MNDKIQSQITTYFMHFVEAYAPLDRIDRSKAEWAIGMPISEMFTKLQANLAKGNARKNFPGTKKGDIRGYDQAISIYFRNFLTGDTIDFAALKRALEKNHDNFILHIGKHRLHYLQLLVSLNDSLIEQEQSRIQSPRGLLFAEAM